MGELYGYVNYIPVKTDFKKIKTNTSHIHRAP